jgi:hypothetical protein
MPKLKHKFNQIRLPSKREWCDGKGNPTRSVLVDMLMSHVPCLSTPNSGAGSKSYAKQKLTNREFELEMNLMWAEAEGDFGSTESDFLRLACGNLISSAESTTHATMNFRSKGPQEVSICAPVEVRWSKHVASAFSVCVIMVAMGRIRHTYGNLIRAHQ